MNQPQISIVLPVYNGSKYLKKAIESLLVQTYTDFEFIILNDGSTDDTEKIIQSFTDERIVYHNNVVNKGLVPTLNIGISMAKGTYIARMDADDVAYPNRLQAQYDYLQQNPDVAVCGAQMRVLGTDDKVPYPIEHQDIFFGLLKNNMIAHPVVTFRKQVYLDNNFQYKNEHFPAEDYMLWVDFAAVSKLHNLPFPLLDYNIHAESISVSKKEIQMKKMAEIKAIHLLRSLSCYNDDTFSVMKAAFAFEFKDDIAYLNALNQTLKTIIKQNNNFNIFDHKQLNQLLAVFWYMANKVSVRNGFKVLKIYFSGKAVNLTHAVKLSATYVISCVK